ncbi:MAG: MlaE family lipid ABC transporter permease subunit [Desulfatiglandaceae bacterium]
MKSTEKTTAVYSIEVKGGETTVHLHGTLDSSSTPGLIHRLASEFDPPSGASVVVDMERVPYMDDFGVLVLLELKKITAARHGDFRIAGASDRVKETLFLVGFESLGKNFGINEKRQAIVARLGEATIDVFSEVKYMVLFLGSICIALFHVFIHPRSLRTYDMFLYMQRTGVDALPIVGLISFLLGLIMAFMSSAQLQQFGAGIYVASLVSLAMTRELGPIMTAIIVAGRSGAAFAAEIGSMKVSEEIDALTTMGFDPVRFLAVPKVLAAVMMMPVLTLFSDLFAIAGGMIVGIFMLDLSAGAYLTQTINALTLFDVFWGISKSFVFAFLIAWIGCLKGFKVRGGAAAVGEAATSAVVSSIFMIIVVDSLFAVILRYW